MTFGSFKELLAEKLAIPKNQFRVWSIVNRKNQTIRPDAQIIEADEENNCKLLTSPLHTSGYTYICCFLFFFSIK